MIIGSPADRSLEGKNLMEIAELWGIEPVDTIFRLLRMNKGQVICLLYFMREEAVETIGSVGVTSRRDYLTEETGLPKANVMEFLLEDGSTLIVRPSGTEPKIKVYMYLTSAGAPVIHEINVLMKKYEEASAN